jgi:hypothetical protein
MYFETQTIVGLEVLKMVLTNAITLFTERKLVVISGKRTYDLLPLHCQFILEPLSVLLSAQPSALTRAAPNWQYYTHT